MRGRGLCVTLAVAGLLAAASCARPPEVLPGRVPEVHAPPTLSAEETAPVPLEPPASELTIPPAPLMTPATRRLLALKDLHLPPPAYLLVAALTDVPDPGRKRIVLTLDDGPSKNTERILRILTRYDAHATFFFVGRRCIGKGRVLRETLAQGSEIGNHTQDHVSLLGQSLIWDESEIERAEDIYHSEAGVRPVWVRPQAGWADLTGIEAISALHKRYVFWDAFGSDTVKRYTSAMIAERVLRLAHPGAIVLLHETNPRTVEALPRILAGLEAEGYEVTTLTAAMKR